MLIFNVFTFWKPPSMQGVISKYMYMSLYIFFCLFEIVCIYTIELIVHTPCLPICVIYYGLGHRPCWLFAAALNSWRLVFFWKLLCYYCTGPWMTKYCPWDTSLRIDLLVGVLIGRRLNWAVPSISWWVSCPPSKRGGWWGWTPYI